MSRMAGSTCKVPYVELSEIKVPFMLRIQVYLRNVCACLLTFTLSIWSATTVAETSNLAVLGACAELQREGVLLVEGQGPFVHVHVVAHPVPVLENLVKYLAAIKFDSSEQRRAQVMEIMMGVTKAHEMDLTDSDCAYALIRVHSEYCTFRRVTDPPLGVLPIGESCDPSDLIVQQAHHRSEELLMNALDIDH